MMHNWHNIYLHQNEEQSNVNNFIIEEIDRFSVKFEKFYPTACGEWA